MDPSMHREMESRVEGLREEDERDADDELDAAGNEPGRVSAPWMEAAPAMHVVLETRRPLPQVVAAALTVAFVLLALFIVALMLLQPRM